jgi:hypothetical protein
MDITKRILVSLIVGSSLTMAQNDENIISRTGSVTLQPEYQRWIVGGARSFTQTGTTLSMYLPVSRSASISMDAGSESYSGDLHSVGGLTDIQLTGSLYAESVNAIFSLGIGVPVGKNELTLLEFQTIALTSNWLFDLDHPGLGTGPTLEPAVSWLIPATEDLVFGVSASFQYKGKYKPLANVQDYDPGEEFDLSGGVDIDCSDNDNISTDVTFTAYGADKFAGRQIYRAGNSISVVAQYVHDIGDHELQLSAGYYGKRKSKTATLLGLVDEPQRIEPNRIDASASFLATFSRKFSTQCVAGLRSYDTTVAGFSDATIFGVSILPTYHVTSSVSLTAKLQLEFGTIKDGSSVSGFDGGLGIATTF